MGKEMSIKDAMLATEKDLSNKPIYARVDVKFKDGEVISRVIIKLGEEEPESAKDDMIFFYVKNFEELLSLCDEGLEDFCIIKFHEFTQL